MPEVTENGVFKGSVAARLDRLEQDMHEHITGCPIKTIVQDHEGRLRQLEATRWQIIGILAAAQFAGVGVILGVVRVWLK